MSNISWIFGILALALLVYEGVALYRGKGETISENTWRLVKKYPVISFLAGLLCGHLFWRVCLLLLALGLAACGLPDIKQGHLDLIQRVNSAVADNSEDIPRGACGSLTGRGGAAGATIVSGAIPLTGGYGSGELRYCAISGEGSSATVGQDGSVTISIGGKSNGTDVR